MDRKSKDQISDALHSKKGKKENMQKGQAKGNYNNQIKSKAHHLLTLVKFLIIDKGSSRTALNVSIWDHFKWLFQIISNML